MRCARYVLLLIVLLWTARSAGAQDLIIDLQGNELTGQIVEVTPTQVLYRTLDSDPALPPTVLDKRNLFMVKFANGTKETFQLSAAPGAVPAQPGEGAVTAPGQAGVMGAARDSAVWLPENELYRRGQRDALRYHSYKGAFWGTYAATLTTGYGGLLVGGIVGLTKPNAAKNPMLDSRMLRSPSYVRGYEEQAQRRKLGKAAEGFGAAVGTGVAIVLIFIALLVAANP